MTPADLRATLVAWYRAHARDLPWRRQVTPYRTLLSELMLQQTRVETVVPYFARFTARWPTLADLAAADVDEVLGMWAGLGYYRRARALLAAAQQAHAQGGLPADPDALRALPGIGPYTAGAIASIAFGVPTPAVDGNVERVIARLDGREDDPKKGPGRRAIAARVAAITAEGVASEVSQGLMELGATVCTPRAPRCEVCPWRVACVAHAEGRTEALPRKAARRPPTPVSAVAVIVPRDGAVLVGKRPPGLLGGLWEPVLAEVDAPSADAARDAVRRRSGLEVVVEGELGEVVHVFTHRRLTARVYAAREVGGAVRGDGSYDDLAFAEPGAPGLAWSRLGEKLLAAWRRPGLPLG